MSSFTSEILLFGTNLSLGESTREVCPACGGGSSNERSLSITLGEDSTLRWQCFRASCTLNPEAKGTTRRRTTEKTPLVKRRPQWDGMTEPLTSAERQWIKENWGIDKPEYWYHTDEYGGRVAMSVRSPKFVHRGWVLRSINPNSRTKALTYINNGEEGLSWYKTTPHALTVVVEDVPSAVRASLYVNSVALLGTGIGTSRAAEIAENATRPIVMALDQDATNLSFKWARKWGLLWGDVNVLPLKQDLKDMKEKELCQLFT